MVSRLNAKVSPPLTKDKVVGEFRCRAIRDAAMRVVGRRGLAHATVQEIADEAGVAKGTVYLYFRSREEIFEKTTQAAVAELLDRLRAAVERGGSFPEVLERYLTTQLAFFDEHTDFFRLYFAIGEGSEVERTRREANRERKLALIVAMVTAGAAKGELAAPEPERVALLISGAIREVILRRVNEKPPRPLEDDVALLHEFICRAVAARRARRLRPA
jgi:TetR/AcrR family fatty acid metabolism transcriptional regulator